MFYREQLVTEVIERIVPDGAVRLATRNAACKSNPSRCACWRPRRSTRCPAAGRIEGRIARS
jgi:hypothetical protein